MTTSHRVWAAFFAMNCLAPVAHGQSSFHGLGSLSGGEHLPFHSGSAAVSADGQTVVGWSSTVGCTRAFRWSLDSGIIAIDGPWGGSTWSIATGVSGDGSTIVGTFETGSGEEGFVWTSGTGLLGLGQGTSAIRLSDDGTVIVGLNLGLPFIGFDASHDGSVVVGAINMNIEGELACRWTAAGVEELPLPADAPTTYSIARAVSSDGRFAVGRVETNLGTAASLWQDGGLLVLGDLAGGNYASDALGVSDEGTVVGFGSTEGNSNAFIWDELNGLRDLRRVLIDEYELDVECWHLLNANDITPDGKTIVGWGRNPSGQMEGWVAYLDSSVVPCRADHDNNGIVNVPDIFAFLSDWFASLPAADFDRSCDIGVPDIFAFLSAWFAGCA